MEGAKKLFLWRGGSGAFCFSTVYIYNDLLFFVHCNLVVWKLVFNIIGSYLFEKRKGKLTDVNYVLSVDSCKVVRGYTKNMPRIKLLRNSRKYLYPRLFLRNVHQTVIYILPYDA